MTDERRPEDDALLGELFPLDGRAGPAPRLPAARADALIAGALDAWQADLPPEAAAPPAVTRRPWLAPALVALTLVGAGAVGVGVWLAGEEPAPSTTEQAPAGAAAPEPSHAAVEEAPGPTPEPTAAEEPVAVDEVDEEATDAGTDEGSTSAGRSPSDLLAEANALRGAGAFAEAERTYLRAARVAPRGRTAYVARVAAAALRLERLDDPRGAIALYRQARRGQRGSALDAEILQGMARAHQRLGQSAAEAAALRELVERHPSSPFAGRARSRLAELE